MKKLFAMLLALCMLCGAMAAGAEEAASGVQEIKVGNLTFEIPTELTFVSSDTPGFDGALLDTYECDRYGLMIMSVDWTVFPYDLDNTSGDDQADNFFTCALMFFGDDEQAIQMLNYSERSNYGMLDGQDFVCCSAWSGVALLSHYFQNNGFMIMLVQDDESSISDNELVEIGVSIAQSFRLDSASEEAMIAAAEAAAAQQYVVITNSSANIRSGPDGSAAKITTAKQGDVFPLLGEDGNWYIIDVNGQTGYVTKGLSAIQ